MDQVLVVGELLHIVPLWQEVHLVMLGEEHPAGVTLRKERKDVQHLLADLVVPFPLVISNNLVVPLKKH